MDATITAFIALATLFIYAIACGLLLHYALACIGSPYLKETANGEPEAYYHSGKIFSFVGRWLAQKFNDYEANRWSAVVSAAKEKIASQNREELESYLAQFFDRDDMEDVRKASDKTVLQFALERVESYVRHSHEPRWINPFAPFGLCLHCTSFYWALGCIVPLYFLEFVPALYIVLAHLFVPPITYQAARLAAS